MNGTRLRCLIGALFALILAGCAATRPAPVQNEPIPGEPAQGAARPGKPAKPAQKPAETAPGGAEAPIVWAWPLPGTIPATYSPLSKGLDFEPRSVLPVRAAADGVVSYVGNSIKSYGEMVVIKHGPSYLSVYANNSKVLVKEGENVRRGQKIAETGGRDSARWHFEIRHQGKPVDPAALLPRKTR
ncbi:MAG: peptidoglycan DD-metalloendopeptidase family protein [Betaproteobacteria bacterium]|nr:peptidoglycan DD-metalloendopeptidase family protein [Betaproteobacteria bacterium]